MSDPTVPLVSPGADPTPPASDQPAPTPPIESEVAPTRPAPAARLNPLAVAALVLGIMLSPLAALFGHIAAVQIGRSDGRERGLVIAWVAVGLGYLWLAAVIVAAVGVGVVLSR